MKKIYFCLVLLFAGLLPACNSLEEDPYGLVSPDQFYRNDLDALTALNAAYGALTAADYYNQTVYLLSDIPTDDTRPGAGTNQNQGWATLDNYTFDASNDEFRRIWLGCYTAINRANTVIDRVPAIQMDTVIRSKIVAEAHFLRALHYFNLVRWFGEVPLVLSHTTDLNNLNVARNSVDEVYAQIIADLEVAERVLSSKIFVGSVNKNGFEIIESTFRIRATNGAATALLAKVYLTRQNWELAAAKAKQVIDSAEVRKTYSLAASYDRVWSISSTEHLFAISSGASSYRDAFAPANSGISTITTGGVSVPDTNFYKSFSDLDFRKRINFMTSYKHDDGSVKTYQPHIGKYGFTTTFSHFPLIRYADVLLMYAEALNEIRPGDPAAYDAVNQVRRRARSNGVITTPPNPKALPDLQNLSQAQFREAVWQERRWELCFEGHRWFDLVRTGRLVEVMKTEENNQIQPYHVLFPIPQRELSVNPSLR